MGRIVLPGVSIPDTVATVDRVAVAPVYVRIAVKVVVHIDVDVVATPTASVAPSTAPSSAHRQSNSE